MDVVGNQASQLCPRKLYKFLYYAHLFIHIYIYIYIYIYVCVCWWGDK